MNDRVMPIVIPSSIIIIITNLNTGIIKKFWSGIINQVNHDPEVIVNGVIISRGKFEYIEVWLAFMGCVFKKYLLAIYAIRIE